jgi:undecaprenyl-diphosphatase
VRRPRPQLADLPPLAATPTQLSFPSAHATSSFAAARVYSAAGAPALPLYLAAAGFAASRVYLGVHYPSDVLAGALLGCVIGSLPVLSAPDEPAGPERHDA